MYALQERVSANDIQRYARTLYENYRARSAKNGYSIPTWREASSSVKKEFIAEAKQELL